MKIETKTSCYLPHDDSKKHVRQFIAFDANKKPSWKRHGQGFAELRISSHSHNKYLEFTTEETAKSDTKEGRYVSRVTMFSLDEPDARKLYQWLKEHFE